MAGLSVRRAPKKCGHRDCETRVVGRSYCDQHRAQMLARSTWGRGSTRQSRRERAIVLTREPTCYLHYPGCTGHATEADHVIPLHRGGPPGIENQRGACHPCHLIKTQRETASSRGATTPPPPFLADT
jgi:5-methylcytosine-specific restriction enzyme A